MVSLKKYYSKFKLYKNIFEGKINFPFEKRINFAIIGAQKCGTTALYSFLNTHPKIIGSKVKEVNFFNSDNIYRYGYHYYHSFFPKVKKNKLLFEASPSYLQDNDFLALNRIYKYNPNIKLIILLRDPIERAFSAYNMYIKKWEENPNWFDNWKKPGVKYEKRTKEDYKSFHYFIEHELKAKERNKYIETPIIDHGKYVIGVEKYINKFGKKNVFVIENEELMSNTKKVLDDILLFLDVKKGYNWPLKNGETVFKGNYVNDIREDTINMLKNIYNPYNKKLFKLLDYKFKWEYF
ncbi:MAG: sulfotransferase [Bacteroidota bacterium]|nr:sulfotransferase [Bacteroidota bacterium]